MRKTNVKRPPTTPAVMSGPQSFEEGPESMSDKIVMEVFRELATLKGLRNLDGTWTTDKPWTIRSLLAEALITIRVAEKEASSAAKPDAD